MSDSSLQLEDRHSHFLSKIDLTSQKKHTDIKNKEFPTRVFVVVVVVDPYPIFTLKRSPRVLTVLVFDTPRKIGD